MLNFISCNEARELVGKGAQLVDVRSPDEFKQTGLPGALNVPLSLLPHLAQELDRDRPLIVYCVTGGRSGQAQALLKNMGFDNVYNLGSYQNYANC